MTRKVKQKGSEAHEISSDDNPESLETSTDSESSSKEGRAAKSEKNKGTYL